jgi:hypothetical protein
MSASYGGISRLEYDVEKVGTLTLGDVSGMLPDYRGSDCCSSAPSSVSSSDTESVGGEEEREIEVSSLHRVSVHIPIPTTLAPPEPAHTHIRRASADVPMPVSVVDAADII